MTEITKPHLGGHAGIVHEDIGALEWAIAKYNVKYAVDIGCGPGHMVKHMLDRGLDAHGIEGDPELNWGRPEKFVRHDYTTGGFAVGQDCDLGWCVEVLEHIEEEFLDNVMTTFKECKVLIVTAAPPGTEASHHHVNCKDAAYWTFQFAKNGFRLDYAATTEMRRSSTMTREFMKNTGMVYVREEGYCVNDLPEWIKIEQGFTEEDIAPVESDVEIAESFTDQLVDDEDFEVAAEVLLAKQQTLIDTIQKSLTCSNMPIDEIRASLAAVYKSEMPDSEFNLIFDEQIKSFEDSKAIVEQVEKEAELPIDMMKKEIIKHAETNDIDEELADILVEEIINELKVKHNLPDNKDIVFDSGNYYFITVTKSGKERKGSRKLVE